MDDTIYLIWISQMKSLTYEDLKKLMNQYECLEKLWKISKWELCRNKILNLNQNKINELTSLNYKKKSEKIYKYVIDNYVRVISCYDKIYPQKLKYINNRPIVLYTKGNLSLFNSESVGIVGSRNCTNYGINCAKYFSQELSKRGVCVVSGLAKGIDKIAHKSALSENGKTIAVIGTGIDMVYPAENISLANKIVENGGLIVSEFAIGTFPEKENFPRRNRIISGLSDAVIVVEAGERSGATITADYAINQGKEVWAIPGNIFSKESVGTNKLLKDGANILTSINDILKL